MIHRYSELLPDALERLWAENPLAIVPWGALEWHGAHLPLGLDGIVAERFCEMLAETTGGVLLPGVWLPITTLPHRTSLQVRTGTMRAVLDDLIASLYDAGARTICLVTGHYAQGHEIEFYEAALRSMEDFENLIVFAATPLEPLETEELMDHAGRYETSQLLAMRPELVRNDRLPGTVSTAKDAVLGEDPRQGSRQEGARLLQQGLEAWKSWIDQRDANALRNFYNRRFDVYQPYVDEFYKDSWEQAIESWWQTQT